MCEVRENLSTHSQDVITVTHDRCDILHKWKYSHVIDIISYRNGHFPISISNYVIISSPRRIPK